MNSKTMNAKIIDAKIIDALNWGYSAIHAINVDYSTARLEVEILLAHVLGCNRSYLYTWPEKSIPTDKLQLFQQCIVRRLTKEPIAYITGVKEFYGLSFEVTKDVLIPRPETETLIDSILEWWATKPFQTTKHYQSIPSDQTIRILDLGTGSGAIALTLGHLAQEQKKPVMIVATEKCEKAYQIAKKNQLRLNIPNVTFYLGDWFSALNTLAPKDRLFDIIVSNPPYIASCDPHLKALQFEPQSALISGLDGLEDIRILISNAPIYLKSQGLCILEHGYEHSEAVKTLFKNSDFTGIFTEKDLAGVNRLTGAFKK